MLEFDATTHTYRRNGKIVPSVTQVLKHAGIIDDTWYTEASRARGTAVHLACEFHDEGSLDWDNLHPEVLPRVSAWVKLKEDLGIEILASETIHYHETYHYAGKIDRLVLSNTWRSPTLLEFKSGTMPMWAGLQTAGYEKMIDTSPWMGATARERPPLRRVGVELRDDGKYKLHEFKDFLDWNAFVGALSVYNWKRRTNSL